MSTTKPVVLNKYRDMVIDAVYIGRPSKWGNPFAIGPGRTRAQAIELYREHLKNNPELVEAAKKELKGRNLVCFCSPSPCHGDVLLEVANAE